MAFPVYESATDTDFATSVTSMAVNRPATVNAGDLLIDLVSVRNAGTWTKPSDMTEIPKIGGGNLSQAGGGSVGKFDGFYKIADGSEGGTTATYTASTGTSGAWITLRISGWHGTTPPEGATTSGDATNANPPSANPGGWDIEDALYIAVASNSATTGGFTAAPTNYINLHSNGASSGGAEVSIATATRELAAASDDPGTFTPNSNRFWAAATIVVRPAAGGGTAVKDMLGMGVIPFAR